MLTTLLRDESGATAIEYGLIAALMITVLIVALLSLGDSMGMLYEFASTVVAAIS